MTDFAEQQQSQEMSRFSCGPTLSPEYLDGIPAALPPIDLQRYLPEAVDRAELSAPMPDKWTTDVRDWMLAGAIELIAEGSPRAVLMTVANEYWDAAPLHNMRVGVHKLFGVTSRQLVRQQVARDDFPEEMPTPGQPFGTVMIKARLDEDTAVWIAYRPLPDDPRNAREMILLRDTPENYAEINDLANGYSWRECEEAYNVLRYGLEAADGGLATDEEAHALLRGGSLLNRQIAQSDAELQTALERLRHPETVPPPQTTYHQGAGGIALRQATGSPPLPRRTAITRPLYEDIP